MAHFFDTLKVLPVSNEAFNSSIPKTNPQYSSCTQRSTRKKLLWTSICKILYSQISCAHVKVAEPWKRGRCKHSATATDLQPASHPLKTLLG